jgi:hypothetical protein
VALNDALCVTRKDILESFGPGDPEQHPGFPKDLSEEAFGREIDVNRSLRRPPYWMRYTAGQAAPTEFEFENSHCLLGVTIGDPGETHVWLSQKVTF